MEDPVGFTCKSVHSTEVTGLTTSQLSTFCENGYLVIPSFLTPSQCSDLLGEAYSLLTHFSLDNHPMTRFATGDATKSPVDDDYFLKSGDKLRFFFEDDAFDPLSGDLTRPKALAINKIGHSVHTACQAFAQITQDDPRISAIARSLCFRDPRLLQSMIICKQPEIGGAVDPHQDSSFLYTDPPSAVGFWIPLVDALAENGCLSFVKGSHRRVPVNSRFVRRLSGGTSFQQVRGAKFPKAEEPDFSFESLGNALDETYTLEEVPAGSLVLIHGNVLHKSEKNTSHKERMAYTFHVIEGEKAGNIYDELNWLQVPCNARGGTKHFTTLYV